MSALGDRLRVLWGDAQTEFIIGWNKSLRCAAELADEHEAVALALSAEGKGPHAAAALRWAAEQFAGRSSEHDDICDELLAAADEADASPTNAGA